MKQTKLNEKESLALITSMIQESREHFARHAAYPILIWGYTTLVLSIGIWYAIAYHGCWDAQYAWFLLPLICYPPTYYFSRKDRQTEGMRTYMERITGEIWTVFGFVGLLLSCCSFIPQLQGLLNIYFYIPLLMSMGGTLSGLVNRYKPTVICGTVGIVSSFGILLLPLPSGLLLFGAIFAEMTIIPGHLLNRDLKKRCLKN